MRNYRLLASFVVVGALASLYACSADDGAAAPEVGDAGADGSSADVVTTPPVDDAAMGDSGDAGIADAAPLPPSTIVQFGAGADHSCALLASGDVWCWGGNGFGQQGLGTADVLSHAPAKVLGLPSTVVLAVSHHHTCALDGAGIVRCWGSNQIMQLGHDNALDASPGDAGDASVDLACASGIPCNATPQPVTGLPAAKAIASKYFDGCARLVTGEVKCWGYNGPTGFLGHAGPDRACFFGNACDFTPSTVSGVPDGPIALSSGSGCVLSSGTVKCWGGNSVSQLAMAADTNAHTTPVAIPGLTGITAIGAGGATPYAIGSGGALYGWGSNGAGELGGGCDASAITPQVVIGSGVVDVGGGSQSGCALSAAGVVTCWGSATHGQLGTPDAAAACQLPAAVGGLADVVKISVGFAHVCALKNDNSLWCWGYNNSGQVGHDPSTDSPCGGSKCTPTPAKVVGLP